MENPHEQVQNALLARIINNVEANKDNLQMELVAQMWENYQANAEFNLQATGSIINGIGNGKIKYGDVVYNQKRS